MLTDAEIRANLTAVQGRIATACERVGRDPGDVGLLLAAKTVPADRVAVAVAAGARLIGENRAQELAEKDAVLSQLPCERHFIGHLQTNKVNQVLRYVTCVQSVDRAELADRLQRRLEAIDATLDVLLQVNTSGESSKFGVAPHHALSLARDIADRDRLRLRGLMTIGLPASDPELIRPSYRRLREAAQEIRAAAVPGVTMDVLSMGMSADLDVAVAEGATMVRVGSAVFGARSLPGDHERGPVGDEP
ncbi:YggS family pyridoxal phosphate-dependent enzyme [Actinobacteria bacterium YIM 96077]|uniref:Pyridoxal phosphate homeostasis protein n=2 Tax=Phytoactinopolyspora halophila TaxID=1981511 RepID=A0A329R0G1_9ACTN|nr:YggS family pyridoxal phosphate-dependent enzyme [Actinobacteria bacterium YIM 96077]RAW17843.1 YggS family pyridoxal phosphate-dependent enzyme [Phytoactinopolyspora halophila]